MIKWIIFYVALTGADEAPMGEALFFQGDSVKIFDTVWKINRMLEVDEHHDKLYYGIFDLQYQDITAHMTIVYHDVTFKIEGRNEDEQAVIIRFRQRPHHAYLYEFIDEEYEVEKKSIDKETRKEKKKRREKYDGIQRNNGAYH